MVVVVEGVVHGVVVVEVHDEEVVEGEVQMGDDESDDDSGH